MITTDSLLNEATDLLEGGYLVPTIATLRTALERSTMGTAEAAGLANKCGNAKSPSRISHILKVNQVIGESLHKQTCRLNKALWLNSHNERIGSNGVANLISEVRGICGRHNRLQSKLISA